MRQALSPSSRGLLPGLFLAVVAAFAVLALNETWLLPALDDDGVAYLLAAPQMAAGQAPSVPSATWDAPDARDGLEERGTAMPLAMAAVIRSGRRAHVGALWVLAVSAGLVVLGAAWVGGGVAGVWGAVAAALAALLSPLMMQAVTTVHAEVLVTALVGLQLGVMVYRPAWSVLHGIAAALAWLAHPVGLGGVAVAVVWPLREQRSGRAVLRAAMAAAPAVVLLAAGRMVSGTLTPPSLGAPDGPGILSALVGGLQWAGGGWEGWMGPSLGGVVLLAIALLVASDARGTAPAPPDVHWSDPAAADALQAVLRPAAALLALGLILAGAAAPDAAGSLARPWTAATLPMAVLAASTAVRKGQGRGGARSWIPVLVLGAWLAGSGANAGRTFAALRDDGGGHTQAKWVSSEVIRWVDNRSTPYPVLYASDPWLLLIQSGRVARAVPLAEAKRAAFVAAFREAPGALVLSGDAAGEADALASSLGLTEVVRTAEGRVLVPTEDGQR